MDGETEDVQRSLQATRERLPMRYWVELGGGWNEKWFRYKNI